MSSITTDQGIVHYETYGQGSPVVLLHGWLGSWGLWQNTMETLGRHYRTYALDFWGFGESGKKRDSYAVSDFVSLVDQFMDRLGIESAPLVGHSMGGTVSLSVAIRYPRRVRKVIVVGSPIVGSSIDVWLKLAGYRPVAMLVHTFPWALQLGLRVAAPLITRHKDWYGMISRDLSQTTVDSFLLSIASLRRTDLRPRLGEIQADCLGIYGARDNIVHPLQWQPLQAGLPGAKIELFQEAGHFPMLDEQDRFIHAVKEFLDRGQ